MYGTLDDLQADIKNVQKQFLDLIQQQFGMRNSIKV